jgi:hypothetical protein
MQIVDLDRYVSGSRPVQKFWGLVLSLAVRDGATDVRFDPACGRDRLSYVVDGERHSLVPPAKSLREEIVRGAVEMLRPPQWPGIARWFRPAESAAPQEGCLALRIGGQEIAATLAVDPAASTVALRLLPRDPAAAAAGTVLAAMGMGMGDGS